MIGKWNTVVELSIRLVKQKRIIASRLKDPREFIRILMLSPDCHIQPSCVRKRTINLGIFINCTYSALWIQYIICQQNEWQKLSLSSSLTFCYRTLEHDKLRFLMCQDIKITRQQIAKQVKTIALSLCVWCLMAFSGTCLKSCNHTKTVTFSLFR